jgi:hypothetical protein
LLLPLMKLIFKLIENLIDLTSILWGLIRTCRWKAGIGWAPSAIENI